MKSMIEKERERWRETAQGNAQEKKKKRDIKCIERKRESTEALRNVQMWHLGA